MSGYQTLIDKGFRRSGKYLYSPRCSTCTACRPSRVAVKDFTPSRSQKRCMKKNDDLLISRSEARYTDEFFDLYTRYLGARHEGGGMEDPEPESFSEFLFAPWSNSQFLEFRNQQGKLLSVAVIDDLPDAFSAVYTFFCPDEGARGLGNYAILTQINLAFEMQKSFVYLGFWIKDSPKMSYKANFKPLQTLASSSWSPLK